MNYMIDDNGIHLFIEDREADAVAALLDHRRLVAVEPVTPEIPIPEAVAKCQEISAQQHAWEDCECERIGVKKCGMCE